MAQVLSIFPKAKLDRYVERLAKRTGTTWQIKLESIRRPSEYWRADLVDANGTLRGVFFRAARGRWQRI